MGGIFGGLAPLVVALRIPAVASAVQIISEAVATLDVFVVELKDGREVKADDHSLLSVLAGEANPWTSSFEFFRQLVIDALTDDRGGLAWVNRIERTRCIRCHSPLPEGHHKFCSSLCGDSSHHYRARLLAANENTAVEIAIRSI